MAEADSQTERWTETDISLFASNQSVTWINGLVDYRELKMSVEEHGHGDMDFSTENISDNLYNISVSIRHFQFSVFFLMNSFLSKKLIVLSCKYILGEKKAAPRTKVPR